MKPEHVARLLNKSNLTAQEKAVITRTPTTPPQSALGYDSANDAEFEAFDAFNETHKGDTRHGGENPLSVILQSLTGRLWHRCFSIRLLGGIAATANEDARALLPVLHSTKSDTVRGTVSGALGSLIRFHSDDLAPALRNEIKALVIVGTGSVSV